MSILNTVESMAMGNSGSEHAQVAGGLLEELQNQPGGIGGLIQNFQRNGMGPASSSGHKARPSPTPPPLRAASPAPASSRTSRSAPASLKESFVEHSPSLYRS